MAEQSRTPTLKERERATIIETIKRLNNVTAAAEELGLSRAGLYSKLKVHGIEPDSLITRKGRAPRPSEDEFNTDDFHACRTGDCPHTKQSECDEALRVDPDPSDDLSDDQEADYDLPHNNKP